MASIPGMTDAGSRDKTRRWWRDLAIEQAGILLGVPGSRSKVQRKSRAGVSC